MEDMVRREDDNSNFYGILNATSLFSCLLFCILNLYDELALIVVLNLADPSTV
jgi:hypothetical protein